MARLTRLSGAFLVESEDKYFLLGNLKRPCDFNAAGFQPPSRDTLAPEKPLLQLEPLENSAIKSDPDASLFLPTEGKELTSKLVEFFMIRRNGSMSERLWELMCENCEQMESGDLDATWLANTPDEIWECVRDSVLRC